MEPNPEKGRLDGLFYEIAEFLQQNREPIEPVIENPPPINLEPPRRPNRLLKKWEEVVFIGSLITFNASMFIALEGYTRLDNYAIGTAGICVFAVGLAVATFFAGKGMFNAMRHPRFPRY